MPPALEDQESRPVLPMLAILAACLCLPSAGCRLADSVWQVSFVEPLQYSSYWHDKSARSNYRRLAHDALEHEKALARADRDDFCHDPFSPAHELGFIDGFVDLLYAGGTGNPPPLPPRRFWSAEFQNAGGYQASLDWFEGFRHGVAVARASGLRQYIEVPVSDALVTDVSGRQLSVVPTDHAVPAGRDTPEPIHLGEPKFSDPVTRRLPPVDPPNPAADVVRRPVRN